MPPATLYRLEVAPLTLLPLGRSPFFSYAAREKVTPGTLVSIPFGLQRLEGIVWHGVPLKGKVPTWMKWIERIEAPDYLTDRQRQLAERVSETTFTPLGKCLKHFIFQRTKKRSSQEEGGVTSTAPAPLPSLSARQRLWLRKLLASSTPPRLWPWSPQDALDRKLFIHFLRQRTSRKKPVLFLVPEVLLVEWWQAELESFFPDGALVSLHSQLRSSELKRAIERIRSGTVQVILGTRQALFAPFPALATIVMTDEEDSTSYKQWEMSPRYATRSVIMELARLHQAEVLFLTPTPSLTLMTDTLVSMPPASSRKRADCESINMRLFAKKLGRSVFPSTLLSTIEDTLKRGNKALLVTKQRGTSSVSICAHCRAVLRCPRCKHALAGHHAGHYSCLACGYHSNAFPECQKCRHLVFLDFGVGTAKLEQELRRHFPRARLLRIDQDSRSGRQASHHLIEKLRDGNYDILIGPYALAKLPSLPKTNLIAMMEADSLLAFPDYQAEERAWGILERLRLLGGSTGKVMIQTFEPERPLFVDWPRSDFANPLQALLADRLALRYPPAVHFIKVECSGRTLAESKKIALAFETAFAALTFPKTLSLELTPHHLPADLVRQKRYQIILRSTQLPHTIPTLRQLFIRFSDRCFYDIDPLRIT